jgi:Tfp pilus assembly protein PilW
MTITLTVLSVATTLIARSLNIRTRSNENVDALADAERALNIMSREIAQAGFNLSDNGIVAADSVTDANGNSTIRLRANLNRYALCECPGCPCASPNARQGTIVSDEDSGEDVKYFIHPAGNTTLLARYDPNAPDGPESTVVANKLDRLRVRYFAQRVTYTTDLQICDIRDWSQAEVSPGNAKYVVIAVCVRQQATGSPGSPGYQPAYNLLLTSDVALRNSNLQNY